MKYQLLPLKSRFLQISGFTTELLLLDFCVSLQGKFCADTSKFYTYTRNNSALHTVFWSLRA